MRMAFTDDIPDDILDDFPEIPTVVPSRPLLIEDERKMQEEEVVGEPLGLKAAGPGEDDGFLDCQEYLDEDRGTLASR